MSTESIFAARISPIARFTDQSPVEFVRKYERLFSKYFNISELIGVLDGNSEYADQNALMIRAGELAKSETDTADGQTSTGKNLASVFSRLSITDVQKDRNEFYRYHSAALSPQNAFPVQRSLVGTQGSLVSQFYKEMDLLSRTPPRDYHAFSVCFDRISQQYMWCTTASDFEGEDISLYDYMKVTEAIMSCLTKSTNEDCPYTMVSGDFSGIQKYIFSIASANRSGVAKRLRARSFYVDIISRIFSQYVVDCFGVGRANILLQTGGKFYCIVPTIDNIDCLMQHIRNEFDEHLYRTFHGSVSVNMAWLCCNDMALEHYSDTIVRLNELLGEKKSSPFEMILKNQDGWNSEAFVLCDDLKGKHVCKNCGTELIDTLKDSCKTCDTQLEIGGKLPRTKYIVYTHVRGTDSYKIFKDYYIQLAKSVRSEEFADAYLIEALNHTAMSDEIASLPVIRKYMANHIPTNALETKTFEEIADASSGMSKLAVLKADVDVLGFLFAQGLRTKEKHFGTISRVNTMSRMLELFFSGYVEDLLENEASYQNVYSVFSGGDDLFLIGPWDVMLRLAVSIQNEFRRFTANNESITMSAAVSVFDKKEHIAYMADYSENQLDRAKNELLLEIYPNRMGRNAVCVMGQLFSWKDFEEQLENAEKLTELLNDRLIEVQVMRRIMKYSNMYKQFLIDKDIWKLMFEPLFYYDRTRNYRFNLNDERCRWFQDTYIKPMENAADGKEIRKNLYFAETVIKIALSKTRRERN